MRGYSGLAWPRRAIPFLHYIYPLLTILYFVLARIVDVFALREFPPAYDGGSSKTWFIFWFMIGVVATYVGETILALTQKSGLPIGRVTRDFFVYTLSASLIWSIQAASFVLSQHGIWYPYYGCWAIAVVAEILLTVFEHESYPPVEITEYSQLEIQVIRICAIAVLLGLFFSVRTSSGEDAQADGETRPLLTGSSSAHGNAEGTAYGTAHDARSRDEAAWKSLLLKAKGYINAPGISESCATWRSSAQDMVQIFLLFWPIGHIWLQLRFFGIVLCVLAGRVLKLLVLYQLGRITDTFSTSPDGLPWLELGLYVFYRWLDSSAGLGAVKRSLWARLEKKCYRTITKSAFGHLMKLSSDSYEHSRSRKLFESANFGSKITRLVDVAAFEVVPTFLDVFFAIGFLWILFDIYLALTVALVSVTYLWMTASLYKIDKDKRGVVNKTAERESKLIHSIINAWQTVLIYNRMSYEMERHSNAVDEYTQALHDSRISHCNLLAIQSSITCIGLLVSSLLAANQVFRGHKPFGNLMILLAYWIGMSGTLYSVTLNWRCIKDDLLVARCLLKLFRTKPTVKSVERAQPLRWEVGVIRFDDVSFGYGYQSKHLLIEHISFQINPTQKVALIGVDTGKSTILKLLFRLYDPKHGAIEIDGQDIRTVTVESLRKYIGIITNECQVFDDSILYNVRYARLDATDQEVFDACVKAGIHEKILTFPDGYNTKVGENGLSLSEGELRKISLAQIFLKDPKVILLDEPEAWADDETETQRKVEELTSGRTTLIAARQRPTMRDADLLLILKDGTIVQRGTHAELVRLRGTYRSLLRMENRQTSLDNNQLRLLNSETEPRVDPPEEENDTSLQTPMLDLVPKAATVLEGNQVEVTATHDLSPTDDRPATVPEETKDQTAVTHDPSPANDKPASTLEDSQDKTAVVSDPPDAIDKPATALEDNQIETVVAHGVSPANGQPASVLEDSQGKTAVVSGPSDVNDKSASALEDSHGKSAVVSDLPDAKDKAATVLEENQGKSTVAHDLNPANCKPAAALEDDRSKLSTVPDLPFPTGQAAAVLGDSPVKNAVTAEPSQTKAKDSFVDVKKSVNDKLERETRWKPDAPEFIPRKMQVLIPNKDSLAKGESQDLENLVQKSHKSETRNATSVKKDQIRQKLSDITNGNARLVNLRKTAAASGQSDSNNGPATAFQFGEVERKTIPSDSAKEADDVVDTKSKISESESDMITRKANMVETTNVENQQDQSDLGKEAGKAVTINDDDRQPKQSGTGQTNLPSEKSEVQALPPSTDLTRDQVDENKKSTTSDVKRPKRRSRKRSHGSKRRQKSTSEESASQVQQVESTKESSELEESVGAESAKVDKPEETITNPIEKDKEQAKPTPKRVRFRRGPQSKSEPSKRPNNPVTLPLRSSLRSIYGQSPSGQDRRASASSDIASSPPGKSSPPSGRRQRYMNWKWRKQNGRQKSGSEGTGSTGGDSQKDAAKTEEKELVADKPVASDQAVPKGTEVDKGKSTSSVSQGSS